MQTMQVMPKVNGDVATLETSQIERDIGTEPTMTVQMHDHDTGNSCSCMEENKEPKIQTIYSYKHGQGVCQETRNSSEAEFSKTVSGRS